MASIEKKTSMSRKWQSRLGSLKLTIPLFILLAIAAALGTVFPQLQPFEFYQAHYRPFSVFLIRFLMLHNLYGSWWFNGLLALLAVNLLSCISPRLPAVLARLTKSPAFLDAEEEKHYRRVERFSTALSSPEAGNRVREVFNRKFHRVINKEAEGAIFIIAERGRWSRLGMPLTHLSILIILAGALIGNLTGFKGSMLIAPGASREAVSLDNSSAPQPLGFSVRCDSFKIEYYPNGTPKDYISDLAILENGREVKQKRIFVNHPLRYRGVTFYQSFYDLSPKSTVTLAVEELKTKQKNIYTASPNNLYRLPGDRGSFSVVELRESLAEFGPAAMVELRAPFVAPLNFWVFKNFPDLDGHTRAGYRFRLEAIQPVWTTGLMVVQDPGAPVVGVGGVLLLIGVTLALLYFPRVVLARVEPAGNGAQVTLAGKGEKNRAEWDKEFADFTARVSAALR